MENGPGLKMYFLLRMGIFHCYASLPEGTIRVAVVPSKASSDSDRGTASPRREKTPEQAASAALRPGSSEMGKSWGGNMGKWEAEWLDVIFQYFYFGILF